MHLKILFEAENFTKFSLEFLGIFYASGYFFQFFIDFLEFFQIGQIRSNSWIRSTKFVSTCFPRPNHVLNHSFSLLTHFPSYFNPLYTISFIPQLLNTSPSPIPSIFTSIASHSLKILHNPKAPNHYLKP